MRVLSVLLCVSLCTVAVAADPDCVHSVQNQVEQSAIESNPERAHAIVSYLQQSGATEEACTEEASVPLDDGPRIPADDIVCEALQDKLDSRLTLIAHLFRMAGECEASPTCDDATKMDILNDAMYVSKQVSALLEEMVRQGC